MNDRAFWLEIRRALITAIRAIERRYEMPSVLAEREERRSVNKTLN